MTLTVIREGRDPVVIPPRVQARGGKAIEAYLDGDRGAAYGTADFASDEAAEAAIAADLEADDFEGVEPSGKGGYTKADVEAVVAEKEGG